MDGSAKVSVIIPVYNGKKVLGRTVKSVMDQDYDNYEVIIVENGSTDGTWALVQQIAEKYPQVRIWQNKVKGTLHARHRGVQLAEGEYITFLDAGDWWVSKGALSEMMGFVLTDKAAVTQFGVYCCRVFLRQYKGLNHKRIINRDELLRKEIAGVMGANGFDLGTIVWNKIYRAKILKKAFVLPEQFLIYSEDMYINTCAMFSDLTDKVVIIPKAFIIYRVGVGVSSEAGVAEKLLKEYCVTKGMAIELAKSKGTITNYSLYRAHRESIYFYRGLIIEMIRGNIRKEKVLSKINEVEGYPFIIEAKSFLSLEAPEELDQETIFLSGNYTANEYYLHCQTLAPFSVSEKVRRKIKKIVRFIMR